MPGHSHRSELICSRFESRMDQPSSGPDLRLRLPTGGLPSSANRYQRRRCVGSNVTLFMGNWTSPSHIKARTDLALKVLCRDSQLFGSMAAEASSLAAALRMPPARSAHERLSGA